MVFARYFLPCAVEKWLHLQHEEHLRHHCRASAAGFPWVSFLWVSLGSPRAGPWLCSAQSRCGDTGDQMDTEGQQGEVWEWSQLEQVGKSGCSTGIRRSWSCTGDGWSTGQTWGILAGGALSRLLGMGRHSSAPDLRTGVPGAMWKSLVPCQDLGSCSHRPSALLAGARRCGGPRDHRRERGGVAVGRGGDGEVRAPLGTAGHSWTSRAGSRGGSGVLAPCRGSC